MTLLRDLINIPEHVTALHDALGLTLDELRERKAVVTGATRGRRRKA